MTSVLALAPGPPANHVGVDCANTRSFKPSYMQLGGSPPCISHAYDYTRHCCVTRGWSVDADARHLSLHGSVPLAPIQNSRLAQKADEVRLPVPLPDMRAGKQYHFYFNRRTGDVRWDSTVHAEQSAVFCPVMDEANPNIGAWLYLAGHQQLDSLAHTDKTHKFTNKDCTSQWFR